MDSDIVDGRACIVSLDEQPLQWGCHEGLGVESGSIGEIASCFKQRVCHVLIAPHAMDSDGDGSEANGPAQVQDVLAGSHAMNHNRHVNVMSQLQVAGEYRCLNIERSAPQAVHTRLADGDYLGMTGALFQQSEVGAGEPVEFKPRVESHRIIPPWQWVKLPGVNRNECLRGIHPMGVEV